MRTDGAMTVGSATLTSLSGSFGGSDVGKYIQVIGAGPGGTSHTDGAMAVGSNSLTSSSANFAQTDIGRGIVVTRAGPGGTNLVTSIAAVPSPNFITLNAAAGSQVTGATYFYGAMTLEGTIRSVQSASTATLSVPAAATISAAMYSYGTDDHAAFQSALDAAGRAGGGTVNAPQPGNCPGGAVCGYILNTTDQTTSQAPAAIRIRYNNVSLAGAPSQTNLFCRGAWSLYTNTVQFPGQTATIRGHCLGVGDSSGPLGVAGESISNSTISKLHFYGMTNGNTFNNAFTPTEPPLITTGDGWDETHKAINLWGGGAFSNIIVDSVAIQDFKGENIFSGGSVVTGMVIRNSSMSNFNGDGVSMLAADLQVINNTFDNGSNAAVENATLGGWPEAALVRQLYQGNTISNMAREGIVVFGVDAVIPAGGVQIVNNTFDTIAQVNPSGAEAAIYFTTQGSGHVAPGNITITGNTCHDCRSFASLQASPNIQVTGNTIIVDKYGADSVLGLFFPITNQTVTNNIGYLTPAAITNGLTVSQVYVIYPSYGSLAWNNVTVANNNWNFPNSPNYTFITTSGSGWASITNQNILWKGETCTGCTYPDVNHGLIDVASNPVLVPYGPVIDIFRNAVPGTATINASKEVEGAQLKVVNVGSQPITFNSDTNLSLNAPLTLSSGGSVTFQYSGALHKFTASVAISVLLTPTSGALTAGQTLQFNATVSGSTNQQVTWSLSPSGVGTLSSAGLYSAPASISSPQTVTVTATSAADPSKSASASVTLAPPVGISLTPSSTNLMAGQTLQFTATVTGTTNQQVNWSLSPAGVGTLSSTGFYTAPASISAAQTVTVTATSIADPTKSAAASILLTLAPPTNNYAYRRAITISHTQTPAADQSDFPVLIQGVYPFLAVVASGGHVQNSSGYDIVLAADSAGAHLLNWELESYNPSTGAIALWVRVPALSHVSDTAIYLFYGNTQVTTFQGGAPGVWDDHYVAVYHLANNAASATVTDSTRNAYTGIGVANTNTKSVAGQDGTALSFNGSSDYIRSQGNFASGTPFTLEGWVKLNAWPNPGYGGYLAAKGQQYFLQFSTGNSGEHGIVAGTYQGPFFSGTAKSLDTSFAGSFHHVAESWDGSTWTVYIDGALAAQQSSQQGPAASGEAFTVGAQTFSGGFPAQFLNGVIDEVRVSSIARPASWIAAEYSNQKAPASFYTLGSEDLGVPTIAVGVSPLTVSLGPGQLQQFTATVTGSANQQVTWSLSPSGAGTLSASGLYTAPASIAATQIVTVTATSAADGTKSTSASVTLTPVGVSLSPSSGTLNAGQTLQFTATVAGSPNQQVTWSLSPSGLGTLSSTGLYTAPASISSSQALTVTATSAADPLKSASATVTLTPVVTVSISPASGSLTAGQTLQFTATVTGSTNQQVTWSLSPSGVGTLSASGLYTAPPSISGTQNVTVTATSAADATKSASASVTLKTLGVSLSPTSGALTGGKTLQFTATVTGTTNQQVTWSLSPSGSGTLSASGLYTAPAVIPAAQTVMVTATSVADTTKSASASVTLTPVAVALTPVSGSLTAGQTLQFTPTVTGSTNQQVTWSLSPSGTGAISSSGLYTAPASIAATQTVTIIATSSADASKSATASVTLSVLTSNGYAYHRAITIAHSQVPTADQSNFPILLQGIYPFLATAANGGHVQSTSGYDIVFAADSAGTRLLNWEVESYNPVTGAISVWIRVPVLSHTNDTTIYLFYGNPNASAFLGNRPTVWDSNYTAVYHLSDNAAATTVSDSTGNSYTGTNAANTNTKSVASAAGLGLTFNGSSDYVRSQGTFSSGAPFTLEGWVKLNAWPNYGYGGYLAAKGQQYFVQFATDNSGAHGIVVGTYTGPFFAGTAKSLDSSFAGSFHHVATSWDGSRWNLYIDGALAVYENSVQGPSSSGEPFTIGAQTFSGGFPAQFLNGVIDEVRVSSVARSASWIAAEYNNQSAPASFYGIGAESQ